MEQKLKALLEHWIEHNEEHIQKYKEWAERLRGENPKISELLDKAIEKFREGGEILKEAYRSLE